VLLSPEVFYGVGFSTKPAFLHIQWNVYLFIPITRVVHPIIYGPKDVPRFFRRLSEGVFDEEDLIFRTHELIARRLLLHECLESHRQSSQRIIFAYCQIK